MQLDNDVIISTQSFNVQKNPMSYSAVIESIDLEVGSTVFSLSVQEYCTYTANYYLSAIKSEMILYLNCSETRSGHKHPRGCTFEVRSQLRS